MTQEEKTNKMQNAKRTDRKYLIRFLLICMGTAILGANVGLGLLIVSSIYFYEKNNGQGDGTFQSIFGLIFLGVFMIGLILLIGISLYNYSKAKKMSMSWNNEDEEVMDAIDKRQNKAKLWNNILMVYSFLFFALSISASGLLELSERTGRNLPELSMFRIISFFGSLLIFIVSIVFIL